MKKKEAVRIDVESFALLRMMYSIILPVAKLGRGRRKQSGSWGGNTAHGPLSFLCAEYLLVQER